MLATPSIHWISTSWHKRMLHRNISNVFSNVLNLFHMHQCIYSKLTHTTILFKLDQCALNNLYFLLKQTDSKKIKWFSRQSQVHWQRLKHLKYAHPHTRGQFTQHLKQKVNQGLNTLTYHKNLKSHVNNWTFCKNDKSDHKHKLYT